MGVSPDNTSKAAKEAPKRLLVVDDSSLQLRVHTALLRHFGFVVDGAGSVKEAFEYLHRNGFEAYTAILSDYRMPEEDGLVLLRRVRQADPSLSVVIITARNDKQIVADCLREGAFGFLDKPIESLLLRTTTQSAIEDTLRNRILRFAASEVRQIAKAQRLLLRQNVTLAGDRLQIVYHPLGQAGGDFFLALPQNEDRFVILVSDVSGHDLEAAYHSAFLQGLARGFIEGGLDLEATFRRLNSILISEWNESGGDLLSLASCAISVDLQKDSAAILNCGLPLPFFCDLKGWAKPLPECSGTPLGWFKELPQIQEYALKPGFLFFWSDGLESLAEVLQVAPLSLAYRLSTDQQSISDLYKEALDDIISVRLALGKSPSQSPFYPLFSESYPGSSSGRIDALQAHCERCLRLALPSLTDAKLHDFLLCFREALLNALEHGCGGAPNTFATVQIAVDRSQKELRLRVFDEGPGPGLSPLKPQEEEGLPRSAHHGLVFLRSLSKHLSLDSETKGIVLEFDLNP